MCIRDRIQSARSSSEPRGSPSVSAAPPVTRGTVPETDPGVRASPFDQTETEPFDSGRLDVDSTMSVDDANRLGESGAAANLVARSGASYGAARGRPFPDVSGLRDERTRNECVRGT